MGEKIFDVYGVQGMALYVVVQVVETALEVPFLRHGSDYMGGDYFRAEYGGGDVVLQYNYLEPMGSWSAPEYQQFPLLICVNNLSEPDVVRECLERSGGGKIEWLSRSIIEGRQRKIIRRSLP